MTTITTTWISIRTTSAATATATTPDEIPPARQNGRPNGRPFYFEVQINRRCRSDDDDPRAELDAAIEADHVLIAHPDAAGRHVGADGPGFVGAMDAVERRSQIHRAGAERILRTALHMPWQVGAPHQHFRRRRPVRPFLLGGNLLDARPGEARAADADAVAQRLSVALHQEQELVRRVDDDRAGALLAAVIDELLLVFRLKGRSGG